MRPIIPLGLFALTFLRAIAHPGHDPAAAGDDGSAFLLLAQAFEEPAAGEEALPPSRVSITVEGDLRVIRANGVPDHTTGNFPNRGNPNRIAAQRYEFRVPMNPVAAAEPVPARMQPFGVAVNGVVFDPGANEWWNDDRSSGWQYEPMSGARPLGIDLNNAHVQPNGAYHYHALPSGLLARLTGGEPRMTLVGWAADGFPIYGPYGHADARDAASPLRKLTSSYRVKEGNRPAAGPGGAYDGSFVADYVYVKGAGDLDECNGRTGVTPEFPRGTYHYVLTEAWPYIPRLYRGEPHESFRRRGPPPGVPRRPGVGQG